MKRDIDLSLMCGRWAISFQMWFFLSPCAVLYNSENERRLHPGHTLRIYAIMIIGELMAGLLFFLAHKTWMANRRTHPKPLWVVIGTWSLAGAVRSTTITTMLDRTGLQVEVPFQRFALSLFVAPVIYGTVAYFLALNEKNKNHFLQIEAETEVLKTHQLSLSQTLADERARLLQTVAQIIVPGLEKIQSELKSIVSQGEGRNQDLVDVSDEISQKASSIVRRISHELDADTSLLDTATIAVPSQRRLGFFELFKFIRIPLGLPILIIGVVGGIVQAQRRGPLGVAVMLADIVNVLIVLSIARAIDRKWSNRTPLQNLFLVGTVSTVVSITSVAVAKTFKSLIFDNPNLFDEHLGGIWSFIACFITTLIYSRLLEEKIYAQTIENNQIALRKLMAEQNEATIQVRRQISAALHGPVLGRLSAASMSLRFPSPTSQGKALELLQEAARDIENLMHQTPDTERVLLKDHLGRVEEQWQGLMDISWDLPESIADEIAKDPRLCQLIQEIVDELATNASRHGSARRVHIEFTMTDSEITIIATDNGIGPSVTVKPGLGSSLASRNKGTWLVESHSNGGAKVTVKLPF